MALNDLRKAKLGKMLLERGLVTIEQLNTALSHQAVTGRPLGEILVAFGYVEEYVVLELLSQQMGLPYFDLKHFTPTEEALKLLNKQFAQEMYVLPVFKVGNVLTVAMADPLDLPTLGKLRRLTNCDVNPLLSSSRAISQAIEQCYPSDTKKGTSRTVSTDAGPEFAQPPEREIAEKRMDARERVRVSLPELDQETVELPRRTAKKAASQTASAALDPEEEPTQDNVGGLIQAAKEAPVIRKVNEFIDRAVKDGASDIHFQPMEKNFKVRCRIDGVLHDLASVPKDQQDAMISRIKIMSDIDIAERRLPQDGRIQYRSTEKDIDVRVSTFPTIYGESVVMRLLVRNEKPAELLELGFSPALLEILQKLLKRPHGMLLVTGPTGSGKTTTLYAALNTINTSDKNIITLEDPVEIRLQGIRQSQVSPKAGLTFATGLRSILRQDPDIIMVGEIRDLDTAEIAIHAALTGHFVLSTLHTNEAAGAVARLLDMGVEPFLVSSSIVGVMAQRLIRLICTDCKEEVKVPPSMLESLNLQDKDKMKFYRGKGCKTCKKTGYRGRSAIAELMTLSPEVNRLIVEKAPSERIRHEVVRAGMVPIIDDGLRRVASGETTLEEILSQTQR